MDHKSIPDPPHSNPNYAFFYFLLPFFSQKIIKVRNLISLFLLCWIGAIYHKGSSINYVVSVGGEGGTPKDDLRRRGEGSKEKLCRLFAEGKKKISREKLQQKFVFTHP